jgi:integrative and conjugative element protein (TIGR02256 family)
VNTGRRLAQRTELLVSVSQYALTLAGRHAYEGLPREVGGILVGWREGGVIIVHDFLLVGDGSSTGYRYDRNHQVAQNILATRLSRTEDHRLGYVGEWHSHPAPQPPSTTDLRALRAIARTIDGPVALIVLAAHRDGQSIEPLGAIAQRIAFGRTHLCLTPISTH